MGAVLDMETTKRMTENELQKRIMVAVSPYATIFRSPAGQYYQGKKKNTAEYGQILTDLRVIKVLCTGFPDLVGYHRQTGKIVLIEVKTKQGRASKEQHQFIEKARAAGCLAGIAKSEEDAIKIVRGDG